MTILQFILLVSDNFTLKLPEKASFCVIMGLVRILLVLVSECGVPSEATPGHP